MLAVWWGVAGKGKIFVVIAALLFLIGGLLATGDFASRARRLTKEGN